MIPACSENFFHIFTNPQAQMKNLALVVSGASAFSIIFYAITQMSKIKELNRSIAINHNKESLAIKISLVAFAILFVAALFVSIPKDLAILSFALLGFAPMTIASIVYREKTTSPS